MFSLFRGWKRKAGCVTLAMACLFASAWIRSGYIVDRFYFRGVKTGLSWMILSGGEGFCLMPAAGIDMKIYQRPHGKEATLVLMNSTFSAPEHNYDHQSSVARLIGIFESHESPEQAVTMIPYWCIVVPLTLISGGLLLSTPREKIDSSTVATNEIS